MNGPILTLLAVIVAVLLAVGVLGAALPRHAREAIGFGGAGLGGLACMLALLSLVLPDRAAELDLPFGLPGSPFTLALDPLSGCFLLLVSFVGTVTTAFAAEATPSQQPASLAGLPIGLAGLLLAVLAGDGLTLAFGLSLAGGAVWAMGRTEQAGHANSSQLTMSLLAATAVLIALALIAQDGSGLRFAAIRAQQAAPGHATAAALVGLVGLAAQAGLVPLHAWCVPAQRSLPPRAAVLLSGGILPVALYGMIRLTLDLADAASPLICAVPLLLVGAASVLLGAIRAVTQDELDGAVAFGSLRQVGMAAIGLGIVLLARAADLPNLAALALGATLLLTGVQALCGTLAMLAVGAIRREAGTRRLDRMGGLVHRMPVSSASLLIGLAGLTGLPPGPGFAGLFLLFQAILLGPRTGGLWLPLLLVALVAILALGSALATASLVRLIGVACLGRPRIPRAAGAEEVPTPARPALYACAIVIALFGILPGPLLTLLTDPAVSALTGRPLGEHAGWLVLAARADAPGYAPLPVALLLGLVAGGVIWWLRRRAPADHHSAAAWQDGFAPPPAWLPFGDPLTQWNGAVFLPPLPAAVRPPLRHLPLRHLPLRRLRRSIAGTTPAMLALFGLLALLAWLAP